MKPSKYMNCIGDYYIDLPNNNCYERLTDPSAEWAGGLRVDKHMCILNLLLDLALKVGHIRFSCGITVDRGAFRNRTEMVWVVLDGTSSIVTHTLRF